MRDQRRRPVVLGLSVALALLSGRHAGAQPRDAVSARAAASEDAQAEAEARAHYQKGDAHFLKQEYREALDELRKALRRKRTRAAVIYEASCLRQLGRYDEALTAYEALRREFPVLSPTQEAQVAPAIEALRGMVGTLLVTGDAPAGAALFIDELDRGTLPLPAPLRLSQGSHTVRAVALGFEPLALQVEVTPRKQTEARLQARSREGLLSVSEAHGWALDVELDGAIVGKTPWKGRPAPGDHEVRLHGFVGLDVLTECAAPSLAAAEPPPGPLDRVEMASPRVTATVKLYQVTPLPLTAEDLDGSLRVEATPAVAAVAIDGKEVGHGTWKGRLPLGPHTVEITAPGFLPEERTVRIERRQQPDLQLSLAPEPGVVSWRPKRNAAVGVAFALGAAGVATGAVTGAAALVTIAEVRSSCNLARSLCPTTQEASARRATSLATASTASLVVGGAGLVAGTLLFVWYRPYEPRPRRDGRAVPLGHDGGPSKGPPSPPGVAWSAGVGPGRFEVEGRF